MNHGWNADHAISAEEVLDDLEDGNYSLVVLDEELLNDSQWSLQDYLDEIGPRTSVLILTEPGSHLSEETLAMGCAFLEHPYTLENLRLTIERMVSITSAPDIEEEEEGEYAYDNDDEAEEDYDWEPDMEQFIG
jgi:DNA-binding NtrC family response regulator